MVLKYKNPHFKVQCTVDITPIRVMGEEFAFCGVEAKSLYSKRSLLPHFAAGDNIYKENGVYKLKGIMVIEIGFDENLWHEMLVKLTKCYSKSMILETLTRYIKNHLG